MITVRRYLLVTILAVVAVATLWNCGGDSNTRSDAPDRPADSVLIQQALDEVVARWRDRDKAVLYDNEFEYLQANTTFDEYLKFDQVSYLEADTVLALNAVGVQLFGERDSAVVKIQVVFQGPTGRKSYDQDRYTFYWHRGRWIRPTVSDVPHQMEWEHIRRQADSAAEAEAQNG